LKEHKLQKFGNKVTSYLGYYITSSLIFYPGHWNRILKCRELGRTGHMDGLEEARAYRILGWNPPENVLV
jgi:hypothetical protein